MLKLVHLFALLVAFILGIRSDNINLAGIFEGNEVSEKAFIYAIEMANADRPSDALIAPVTDNDTPQSYPFRAMNSTCNLITNGVAGMFGPRSFANIEAVQSVCDENEIPHILTRWNNNPSRTGTVINFYPHAPILAKAYIDIVMAWDWKTFTILYEDNESLVRVTDLVIAAKEAGIVVTLEQLDKYGTENYRPILKKVWQTGQKFFAIDCRIEYLKMVLLQCQQIGMMTYEYNYFLTNLDTHTLDLLEFQFSEVNITGIRLINPESPQVQQVSEGVLGDEENAMIGMLLAWKLQTETALLVDAVNMFSKTLNYEYAEPITTKPLSCSSSDHWEYGLSITNILKSSVYRGLTGDIRFDNEGYRSDFELEVFEIREGGITKVGNWNQKGLNITRVLGEEIIDDPTSMKNKTFIVSTTLTDPYGMLKESSKALIGNDRFEGFGIDLITELSQMEGFNCTFVIREDKKNGKKEDNGEWSGMIGDLMAGRADLAITDLTITSDREEAVDFTSPFMNLGISILFRKPSKAPPNFFSFAEPFALDTWIALGISFLVVSISFFVLGRMCPDEWTNPYPCIEEPEFLVNQFSMGNSFWFSTGAIMCQGSEIAPIAVATRMLSGIWWFFVLLIVASYTANLASFLVTENKIELFTDVASLVDRAEELGIKYGAKAGGATATFFENQRNVNPIFAKIDDYMKKHPEDMVKENKEGVERADKYMYAFFMESTSIEYETQRRCDLTMVGGLLDSKGYGIAMRKNSPYRTRLSTAILKLQSSGVIDDLKRKWWEERRGGGQCMGEADETEATPLDVKNVEGVFYVTIYGTVAAAFLVMIEYLINISNTSKKTKIKFKEVFKEEVKHYIDFSSNTKPVIGASSDSKSGSEEEKEQSKSSSRNARKSNGNGDIRQSQSQTNFPCGFKASLLDERLSESP